MVSDPHTLPVAVDAMGGDFAPSAVIDGAVLAAEQDGIRVLLTGDEPQIRAHLPVLPAALCIEHAPDLIAMDDSAALTRQRPQSSIRVAARAVAEGRACALVGCGHSGAVLYAAVLELGKLEGVNRPALGISLPTRNGGTLRMLDIGTTTDCAAHQLEGFALLGQAWARSEGLAEPRIGLLSNGVERGKGTRAIRAAAELIAAHPVNFVGQVEPDAALEGAVDVAVCDGFTGNIVLKAAEGIIGMSVTQLLHTATSTWRGRVGAWLLKPAFRTLAHTLDWRKRGGAVLLGVPAVVVVGHGRADAAAVRAAIRLAHYAHHAGLVESVAQALKPHESVPSPAPAGGSKE